MNVSLPIYLCGCALVLLCSTTVVAYHGEVRELHNSATGVQTTLKNIRIQLPVSRDTAHVRTQEVIVEAVRPSLPTLIAHTRSSELGPQDLQRLQTRQSSELLSVLPGVFVRDYGGLAGIKTISLRGTTAAQNAVYLDGVRLNGSQNGLFDFSTLPSSFLSSLVISDAVDATLSGSHAIGGIVMFQSLRSIDTILQVNVRADIASWNERGGSLSAGIPMCADSRLYVATDVRRSDGDYPFAYSNFGSTSQFRRSNADYQSANAMIAFSHNDSSVSTTTRVLVRSGDRGAPDAVTQGNIGNASARLRDESMLFLHTATLHFNTMEIRWNVFANVQSQQFSDTSTSLLGVPFRQRFFSRDAGGALSLHAATGSHDEFAVRAEVGHSDLRGDLLRFQAGSAAERQTAGLGMSMRSRPVRVNDDITLYLLAGVRCDAQSDAPPQWTPRTSILVRFWRDLEMSIHGARAFRLPSFNELYYQNYGSVNLVPEQSQTWRVAAEYTVRADTATELVLSAKVYTIETTNQIIAIPRSLVTWSATNIAAVRSRGVELGAIARYQEWLTMRGGVTIQDVRDNARDSRSYGKIIPYVPTTLAYVRCDATHGGVVVGGGLHACGVRYTQTDNVPESALNAYITANANVGYQWRTRAGTWKLRVDCDNLLDAAYSVIANYPMPGRMMRASMEWQW